MIACYDGSSTLENWYLDRSYLTLVGRVVAANMSVTRNPAVLPAT
jgi:hypothetical protein